MHSIDFVEITSRPFPDVNRVVGSMLTDDFHFFTLFFNPRARCDEGRRSIHYKLFDWIDSCRQMGFLGDIPGARCPIRGRLGSV